MEKASVTMRLPSGRVMLAVGAESKLRGLSLGETDSTMGRREGTCSRGSIPPGVRLPTAQGSGGLQDRVKAAVWGTGGKLLLLLPSQGFSMVQSPSGCTLRRS